jgi:hypothetical protein
VARFALTQPLHFVGIGENAEGAMPKPGNISNRAGGQGGRDVTSEKRTGAGRPAPVPFILLCEPD